MEQLKSKVAPADGKLAILLPGMGAVATTFIAGVEAVKAGLGKPIGVAGAFVAMLAYNAAFWSLAGAVGYFGSTIFAGIGIDLPWQFWAAAAVAIVAFLGRRAIGVSAKVLGIAAFEDEIAQARFNDLSHWGYGTGWGVVRGLLDAAGLPPRKATAAHGATVWGSAQLMLPALVLTTLPVSDPFPVPCMLNVPAPVSVRLPKPVQKYVPLLPAFAPVRL